MQNEAAASLSLSLSASSFGRPVSIDGVPSADRLHQFADNKDVCHCNATSGDVIIFVHKV